MMADTRNRVIVAVAAISIGLLGCGPALSGELEDGLAAYEAGDYERSLQILTPLAEDYPCSIDVEPASS